MILYLRNTESVLFEGTCFKKDMNVKYGTVVLYLRYHTVQSVLYSRLLNYCTVLYVDYRVSFLKELPLKRTGTKLLYSTVCRLQKNTVRRRQCSTTCTLVLLYCTVLYCTVFAPSVVLMQLALKRHTVHSLITTTTTTTTIT